MDCYVVTQISTAQLACSRQTTIVNLLCLIIHIGVLGSFKIISLTV